MSRSRPSSRRIVVLAAALVVVLGGSLALRWVNRVAADDRPPEESPRVVAPLRWTGGPAPSATVPPPRSAALDQIEFPAWARPAGPHQPIRFLTDLDLIAPLGNGPQNAAPWFADFAKFDGARLDELMEAQQRAVEARREADTAAGVLPNKQLLLPDDPLLLEAEPWVDQATLRFYPDVWHTDGWQTPIPNLLIMLSLAKSWVARGDAEPRLELAMEDYRRAIRLGRLVRQEDAILITDLVGLACIGAGLEAMYDRLIAAGETEQALVVSLALGEVAPQRLRNSELFTQINIAEYVRYGWFGVSVEMSEDDYSLIAGIAEKGPHRRFRLEAILVLNLVRCEGNREQRAAALELLERLVAEDEDELITELATWAVETRLDTGLLGVID
jgi:hypothetical protein